MRGARLRLRGDAARGDLRSFRSLRSIGESSISLSVALMPLRMLGASTPPTGAQLPREMQAVSKTGAGAQVEGGRAAPQSEVDRK